MELLSTGEPLVKEKPGSGARERDSRPRRLGPAQLRETSRFCPAQLWASVPSAECITQRRHPLLPHSYFSHQMPSPSTLWICYLPPRLCQTLGFRFWSAASTVAATRGAELSLVATGSLPEPLLQAEEEPPLLWRPGLPLLPLRHLLSVLALPSSLHRRHSLWKMPAFPYFLRGHPRGPAGQACEWRQTLNPLPWARRGLPCLNHRLPCPRAHSKLIPRSRCDRYLSFTVSQP